MGMDADPFPAVSVDVNVADLRSVARNRSLPYAQRNLAAEDLRWVLEAQRSKHSRSVRSDQQRLGGQGRIIVIRNFSPEGARRYSTGTRSPRMVKPPLRSPSRRWEKVNHPKFAAQNPRTLRCRLQRKRADERKRQQKQVEAEGSSSPKPRQPTKRNMVWVRKEKNEAVTQNLLKGNDQSPASAKVASLIVSQDGVLKATFEAQEQSGNHGSESKDDGTIHFGEFSTEEEVIVVLAQDDEEKDMADKIVFEKPEEKIAKHIRPLYINAHMDGTPISRVLVDNGAAVNVLPTCMLYKIGKSLDDLVHTEVTISDFTGGVNRSRGVLPVELTVGNRTLMSAFFVVDTVATYNALLGRDWIHSSWSEIVHEGEEADQGDEITLEELDLAPAKLDDLKVEVQDPLEEINLGSESEPKVTFISGSLEPQTRGQIVRLLHEFKDCFAWDYLEMPATPKDEYPMPIADLLVDGVARHKILSFMDGHSGYNQIFIADADVPKTAFRCPGAVGTFEWVVMPFGLKNAGATYQRAMNAIFHDMIGKFMEIYIDDVVVKSHGEADHLVHLRKAFERMRQHGLKMNPLKCAFEVSAGNFFGYLVHERDLEVDKNKARAVIEAKPPQNKKELQRFLGQVNFLRRFISNLAGKTRVFSALLKLKFEADFKWEEHHQSAFDMIKRYLSRPPVLVPPVKNKPLILYISAADESIGCLLAQGNDKKQEQAMYYLSQCLTQTEVKYSSVEKLCLALFFAAIKLRHYLIYFEVYVVAKTDIVKYMLSCPLLRGRIGKWILALSEFNLKYIPQKAVKGQALADFLTDHPCLDVEADEEKGINLFSISLVPWKLIFDGSSTETMAGAGVVVISPFRLKTQMSFQLDIDCTNNQAEYDALIIGFEILVELKVSMVEVIGDSQLVLKQLSSEYKCTSLALAPYFALAVQLLEEFDDVSIRHVSRDQNYEANEMAQIASSLRIPEGVMQKVYLKDQSSKVSRKTKMQALNYVLIEDVLYRRGNDELLLHCLGPDESFQMLSDAHDGICGAHQAGIKMRWLIRRHGFFWSSVLKDCIAYAKGCKSCQIHGPLERVPASELNSIVKPWPFRGWAIDLIGKVYPPSSKGHSFIIVATDYFTKWVEAKPMKKVNQYDVIKFIKEDIIHRFGLPETITIDQGTVFVSHQVEAFAKEMGFRLLNSTPHYAQANGQAEASNKVVINFLEKMVDDNPRRWHELLSETLWAYRTFALTYGHDAVLPMELTARSLRVVIQHNLQSGEYDEAMMLELENLEDSHLTALDKFQAQKLKIAKSYNKRVKGKNLVVGDLVWKAILPLGKKDHRFGKWSPNWEGPFRIHEVLRGGAYWFESLDGELHPKKINGIHLKPYFLTVWEAGGLEFQEAV
ncbi:hypothetical protein SLEP1_g3710 [Rubroshorea leprosula]|uniref:Uncharacterized protein n=1 Tax=Rubroshorea leprosula TaxID=152421 RepID=A0AAV5HVX0_9ROSI|nr:hypothetical protein SLEP1_g3710 [Rubroshorea leprosula]